MHKVYQHIKTHEIRKADRPPNEDWIEVPECVYQVMKERHPEGSKYHALIKDLGSAWSKTTEWKMRQAVCNAAAEIETEAHSFEDTRHSLYCAESMVDLALACSKYLELFENTTGLAPGNLKRMTDNEPQEIALDDPDRLDEMISRKDIALLMQHPEFAYINFLRGVMAKPSTELILELYPELQERLQ